MSEQLQLSSLEAKKLHKKIIYILTDRNFDLLKNASNISFVTALIPFFAFYNSINKIPLYSWLVGMILVHLGCLALVYYYKYRHPSISQIDIWRNIGRVAVVFSTFMWGSMGLLLVSDTAVGQNLILFFIIIIASSIALGTTSDYLSSSIGIFSALAPFIGWQMYQGIIKGSHIHLYAGTILILFLIFLHIVSYISYKLLKKSLELGFRNEALAAKLSKVNIQLKDLNNELEDRVVLRTKELNSAFATMTYQATHDLITYLPNLIWVLQYVSDLILKTPQKPFAILCLSINNMESITDRYGYYSTDAIIKVLSNRFVTQLENQKQSSCSYKIAISRRDVFVILVENFEYFDIKQIIQPIFVIFEKPVEIHRNNLAEYEQLFCSVGYSVYPIDAIVADQLLIKADTAMFYTKKQYENNYEHRFEHYSKEITENIQYKVQLRKNIQIAIDKNDFYLCYQPIVDIKTGLIVSTEALLRWVHPITGRAVPPIEIIKIAEEYNLIVPLGEWVLRKACMQNYHWHKLGIKKIVSVNLSAKQLEKGNIVETVTQILNETDLSPEFLDLELTETEVFKDEAIDIVNGLRQLGVSLSIDDYGQGFSNLSKLKKFSFNKIKIDMEFIRHLPNDVNSQIIVTSSIKMAKALGIKIVAEGVETQEQLEFLAKQGCDLVQGYFFYKPLTNEEMTEIFMRQKHHSSKA